MSARTDMVAGKMGSIVFWTIREKRVNLNRANDLLVSGGFPAMCGESFIKLVVDAACGVGAQFGWKPKLVKRQDNVAVYRMAGESVDKETFGDAVPKLKLEQESSFEVASNDSCGDSVKYEGAGEFAGRMGAVVEAWRGTVSPEAFRAHVVDIVKSKGVSLRETGGVYFTPDVDGAVALGEIVKALEIGEVHVCPVGGAEWAVGVASGAESDLEARLKQIEGEVDAVSSRAKCLLTKAQAVMEIESLANSYGELLENEALAARLAAKAQAIQAKIVAKSSELAAKAASKKADKPAKADKTDAEKGAEFITRREGGLKGETTGHAGMVGKGVSGDDEVKAASRATTITMKAMDALDESDRMFPEGALSKIEDSPEAAPAFMG